MLMFRNLATALCALAFLASCGEPNAGVSVDEEPHEIDASGVAALDDVALRALLRGATIRVGGERRYVAERFTCRTGWSASGHAAPFEGEYNIANGQVCTSHGCHRIYELGDDYYRVALAGDPRRARRLEILHKLPCPPEDHSAAQPG